MQVIRFDTFDGKQFFDKKSDDPEIQIKEFWQRYMEGRGEEAQKSLQQKGQLNKVTLLEMNKEEYYALPSTNESYKYLGVEQ